MNKWFSCRKYVYVIPVSVNNISILTATPIPLSREGARGPPPNLGHGNKDPHSNTAGRSLMAQTKIFRATLSETIKTSHWANKNAGKRYTPSSHVLAMWLLWPSFENYHSPWLCNEALCSHFYNVKVKLPLKGTFPPTYRSYDPVLTSQLPFKGIKVRSLFVYMSAMTPSWT